MKKIVSQKNLTAGSALLLCVVARSRAAGTQSADIGKLENPSAGAAEQQPITLDPVIVREQPPRLVKEVSK